MRTSPRFLVVIVMAVVALSGTTSPAAGAAGVQGIPVQQVLDPMAFELCTPEGPGAVQKCEAFGLPPTYKVPAGRRLVIEQVSGDCGSDVNTGQPFEASIIAQTKGAVLEHVIIGTVQPNVFGGKIPLTLTRIYGDANSLVTIGLTGVPGFADRHCRLTFSGQLVKS